MVVLGALLWLCSAVLRVGGQLVAAAAWETPYSWDQDLLSHLGNTDCGLFLESHGPPQFVCSPLYALLNTALVLAGLGIIGGALLLRRLWPGGWAGGTAYVLMLTTGVLEALTGLVPENISRTVHLIAALHLPIGGIAIFLVSLAIVDQARWISAFGYLVAGVTVIASMLFSAGQYSVPVLYFGLGAGAMERLASYPFTLWLLVIGLILCTGPGRAGCRACSRSDAADPRAA
ncbi:MULTISPECIES: DUF998 domain-containing protein [unclassified Crossiella]|uniref:DUF998 domain-containing protein n=1 Tax=unclassified Crossiella TaxID=2620835 RepID=UPI001FFED4C8|nr:MULTISPECIES: DUF998 domain-containing protein [unclassified Crossiella]MCK2245463.1 DUF998 domain-containing protein [Crossiella sp. S99.2]MCK2259125.1 DUF998 domain-containing protein [Crossiella sp. S99.1]